MIYLFVLTLFAQAAVPPEANVFLDVVQRGGAIGAIFVLILIFLRVLSVLTTQFTATIDKERESRERSERDAREKSDDNFNRMLSIVENNTKALVDLRGEIFRSHRE